MNWKQLIASRREELLTVSALLTVSMIAFGRFDSGIISSDDWSYFVRTYVFGPFQPINWTDRRPFVLVLYYGLASLFGLKFQYYYFFNFIILSLSAVMVYAIVKRAFPGQAWIAGPAALASLVYPVDSTRTWLIMIYIRFWWLVTLGVIWLLMEFASSGKPWAYALAILGMAFPLGAYEGQFGVLLLGSALIAYSSRKAPVIRRVLVLAGALGTGVAFLLWRTYIQERLFEINDIYVETLQFSPIVLLERYLYGLYLFFIGWLEPILAQLEIMGVGMLPWLVSYAVVCVVFILWLSSRRSAQVAVPQIPEVKNYLKIFLVGAAFWAAGYIPIIALYSPTLGPISSRVNTFAIPGAALMLVSGLAIFAMLAAHSTLAQRLIVLSALLPFIAGGIFAQLQVDQENRIAWETQKKIWKGVFAAVPNLQDEKVVVVMIPGYNRLRPFQSFPFASGWEIEAGAQVLYNNPSIGANYYYMDIQAAEALFTQNGFRPIPTDKVIPYKKLIFVYYDPMSGSVTLVQGLAEALSLPFPANNYLPLENIISAGPSTGEFRWLVE